MEGEHGETVIELVARRLEKRVAELEAALWVALDGREVVVRENTPRAIEWSTLEDGGRMVRRANR